jgi:hypothetical protein
MNSFLNGHHKITAVNIQLSENLINGMAWDQFLGILNMVHINNDKWACSAQPSHDPVYKMTPTLHINPKFWNVNMPKEFLTNDEAICTVRGSIYFQAYRKWQIHKLQHENVSIV